MPSRRSGSSPLHFDFRQAIRWALVVLFPCLLGSLPAQTHDEGPYFPVADPLVQAKLEQWQDLKFGLLMHWGPYSQWGIVESWSICAEDEDWCRRPHDNYELYKKEYEDLQTTFNPAAFDPAPWAAAARKAGMKYVVFTTKHHDGFCMFNTRYTDYKITDPNCPFHTHPQADVTGAIFDAFRQEDFMIGAYFSKPDWHSPYYWWPNFATPDRNVNYNIDRYPERWQQFVDFTHNQIDELMSNYGRVDILWLDGGWVRKRSEAEIREQVNRQGYQYLRYQNQDIDMDGLVAKARAKQPGLIVVDRAVPGPHQNYLTPENRIPEHVLPYPWESPMIAGQSWSHIPNAQYLSPLQVITMLTDIVAKGGNLLLNIAPSPQGTFDEGAYEMLAGVADWMAVNSEAIYDTRPFPPHREGKVVLTRNRHTGAVYLIYRAVEGEEGPPSRIWLSTWAPEAGSTLQLLGSELPLVWEKVNEGFVVEIPESLRKTPPCAGAWVVKVKA